MVGVRTPKPIGTQHEVKRCNPKAGEAQGMDEEKVLHANDRREKIGGEESSGYRNVSSNNKRMDRRFFAVYENLID